MATELPVRIEFRLPDGWTPAPPDEVDAPDAAFVALHPRTAGGFTPNITIAGQHRPDDASLDAIADESVRRLGHSVGTTQVRNRTETGSTEAPCLTQVLDILTKRQDAPGALVQCQVYLSMLDVHEPAKRAVIQLVLTCTREQLDGEIGDFQEFVRTVRPTDASASGTQDTPDEPPDATPRHTSITSNGTHG